jgi:hypothetical protein
MAATNKRLLISESRSDSMYTLQEKIRPAWHICFPRRYTYTRRTLPAGGPRTRQPFASHQQRWTDPTALEKKGWVIRKCTTLFLSQHSHWSSNESQTSIDSRLLGLPDSYHRHAIGTFNTCSWVPTPRFLTDTGGGYHIENIGIATTLFPPFPSEGSTDPLNGPARS